MKKILFTDLDGTLLNDDKLVSEGNRAAIEKLLEAGHYLVVTTGRPVKSGFQVAQKLGLTMPGCYMIAYNGGAIVDGFSQEIQSEQALPMECVQYLFAEAEKYGLHIQTYDVNDRVIVAKESPELQTYLKLSGKVLGYNVCENVCESLDKNPNKVLIICEDEERLHRFWREHQDWEEGRCESTFSSSSFLEYLPMGVSKGNGVRMLCDILHINIKNAYAVGDERNDVSMIEAAGTGIAMKNAVDEAKAVADYITEHDNNHDAIAEVIERLILN